MNVLVKIARSIIVILNVGLSILLAFAASDQSRTHSAFLDSKPSNTKLVLLALSLLIISLLVIYFLTIGWKKINKKLVLIVSPIITLGLGLVFIEVLALN